MCFAFGFECVVQVYLLLPIVLLFIALDAGVADIKLTKIMLPSDCYYTDHCDMFNPELI